jgi:acyl carrier protein
MTTMEKVCELILKLKKKDVSLADLKPEARLADDLGLDSLDRSELLVLAEDEFSIKVPLEEVQKVTTVGAAAECLDRLIAARGEHAT